MDNFQSPPQLPKKRSWLLSIVLFLAGLGVAVIGLVAVMIMVTYPRLPSMDELRNYQPKLPLQVYSADGVLLGQFGQERRIYVDIPETPKLLIDAILSAEDERFYEHGGIDILGIMRATIGNIATGHLQSGASTITMQVARNFFLTKEKTFTRKFNEILLSYKIEHSLTKDQILSLYINQIYLGQRAYGFAEAARTYFGKP
ncbi:MAG: peptidase, partial [Proteobacteria bacterium]